MLTFLIITHFLQGSKIEESKIRKIYFGLLILFLQNDKSQEQEVFKDQNLHICI